LWKSIGNNVKIINSYRSDHCPIIFQLKLNDFILGRGLWKFNNSLLYEMDYVEIVKETIKKKLMNSMLHSFMTEALSVR
jgi:hypothetical protein